MFSEEVVAKADVADDPEEVLSIFAEHYPNKEWALAAYLAWSFGERFPGMTEADWLDEARDIIQLLAHIL